MSIERMPPLTRRELLHRAGLGFGMLVVRDLLARDAPLAPKQPHWAARAKSVIYLFMHGGPSQVDTFDPKPALKKLDGQAPPAQFHKLQFQFIDVKQQVTIAWAGRHSAPG